MTRKRRKRQQVMIFYLLHFNLIKKTVVLFLFPLQLAGILVTLIVRDLEHLRDPYDDLVDVLD